MSFWICDKIVIIVLFPGKTRQFWGSLISCWCPPWARLVEEEMRSLRDSWGTSTSSPSTRLAQRRWETFSLSLWTGILTTTASKCRSEDSLRYPKFDRLAIECKNFSLVVYWSNSIMWYTLPGLLSGDNEQLRLTISVKRDFSIQIHIKQ